MYKKTKPYLYQFLRPIFTIIFKTYMNPTVVNAHYLPSTGACVSAGNHKHALDPILMCSTTKRVVHTLAKKELHDGPFGWFFRSIGSIPVDLDAKHNPDALHCAVDYLNEGYMINLYPEAERNYTDEIVLPFKNGATVMAKRTGCKIIPYCIVGDYKFRSRNLKIVYGKPLDVSNLSVEEGTALLRETIKQLLLENRYEK